MLDTIAAIATAPGRGALAVVRLSGPRAREVLGLIAPGDAAHASPRSVTLAKIRDPGTGELLDQALVTVFAADRSYTGEDVVEISTHGGHLTPVLVLDACLSAGAREAEPGEFTKRAYLHGKMDLVQAEAVLDLIDGRSPAGHRAAIHQLDRGLSTRVAELRSRIIHLQALLVHYIDFPEEDDPPVPLERIAEEGDQVVATIEALLATAAEGELLREGAVAVLAGRPNSGKSSLFNALVGHERAIVTDIPGTTRDAIEVAVSLGGYPFRLVDTAGLRDPTDPVERIGIEVAGRYLDRADVVLLCVEAGGAVDEAEETFVSQRSSVPIVWVWTKADLLDADPRDRRRVGSPPGVAASVVVSALSGHGLDELRSTLPSLVYAGLVGAATDSPVLMRRRQATALEGARAEVAAFSEALRRGVPPEVAATHLKPAETALEEVTGVITADDVLDRVFQDFCVGK